jgi:beta-phosphoglucomutase
LFPALIFDLDGVIVNSNRVHTETWAYYVKSLGRPFDESMRDRVYGKHNSVLVRELLGDDLSEAEVKAHGAAKEALFRRMIGPQLQERLVPGLHAFLERNSALPLAVASNAESANVQFILGEGGLKRFFRVTLSGDDVLRPKPHPEIFLRAAEELGRQPGECVVFEDSYGGIEAAKAAGMAVVALRTTHAGFEGVDLEIDDFRSPDLDRWLEGRRRRDCTGCASLGGS